MIIDKQVANAMCKGQNSFQVPNNVTAITAEAFEGHKELQEIRLNEGLLSIGEYAFLSTSLKQITLPNSIKYLDDSAFRGCRELVSISVLPDNEHFCSQNGILYTKDMKTLIKYPENKTDVSYTLPESVKIIAKDAFKGNLHLESVYLHPVTVKDPPLLFNGCKKLKECILPPNLVGLNVTSFAGTPWMERKKAEFPLVVIDNTLIDGMAYTNSIVQIPEEAKIIASGAFANNQSIQEVQFHEGITAIESLAFINCRTLERIQIPSFVDTIQNGTFSGCVGLKTVEISDSVKKIESYAFCGCKNLKSLYIPDSVTEIEKAAFDRTVIIQCNADSYAEQYACKNGYNVEILPFQEPQYVAIAKIGIKYSNQELMTFLRDEKNRYYKIEANTTKPIKCTCKSVLTRITQAINNPEESIQGNKQEIGILKRIASKQQEGREF